MSLKKYFSTLYAESHDDLIKLSLLMYCVHFYVAAANSGANFDHHIIFSLISFVIILYFLIIPILKSN